MGETPGSVVTLLCSGMHFFNAEKRIADCVLEDTAGVAAMTSAELAHCSSTSEATVTRFCKKLGFENYRAFQLALARDVMERQPLEISNEVQLDNIPQSLQNILSNKIDEMSATINGINPENLQRVLELLQNAQLVQIAAVGNTIPVAMDAAFKFNQLGMRCITSEISEKNSAFALTLTPQDVLLLISNSGKSRQLNQMAQTARDNGVPVVLITCDRSSPLAQLAAGQKPELWTLLLGNHGGCLGETSALALLIGFAYLLIRSVISWHTPVCFVGTVFVMSLILGQDAVGQILSGGLMLGAIFMATDYSTTPSTDWGRVLFGIGAGLLTVLIRFYGAYAEGVSFAILFMNILTPYLSRWTETKPFGGVAA